MNDHTCTRYHIHFLLSDFLCAYKRQNELDRIAWQNLTSTFPKRIEISMVWIIAVIRWYYCKAYIQLHCMHSENAVVFNLVIHVWFVLLAYLIMWLSFIEPRQRYTIIRERNWVNYAYSKGKYNKTTHLFIPRRSPLKTLKTTNTCIAIVIYFSLETITL